MKNEQKRAVDQECILEPFLLKMIDLDTRSKSVLKLRTVFSKFKIKTVGIPTVSWRRAWDFTDLLRKSAVLRLPIRSA